jgi:hypothetical protein
MPSPSPRAAARAALVDVLETSAAETAALGLEGMRDLLPVLAQARQELDRDLAAWLSRGKATDRWTPQAYRQSLLGIDAAMTTAQELLRTGLLGALVGGDATALARLKGVLARISRKQDPKFHRELSTAIASR